MPINTNSTIKEEYDVFQVRSYDEDYQLQNNSKQPRVRSLFNPKDHGNEIFHNGIYEQGLLDHFKRQNNIQFKPEYQGMNESPVQRKYKLLNNIENLQQSKNEQEINQYNQEFQNLDITIPQKLQQFRNEDQASKRKFFNKVDKINNFTECDNPKQLDFKSILQIKQNFLASSDVFSPQKIKESGDISARMLKTSYDNSNKQKIGEKEIQSLVQFKSEHLVKTKLFNNKVEKVNNNLINSESFNAFTQKKMKETFSSKNMQNTIQKISITDQDYENQTRENKNQNFQEKQTISDSQQFKNQQNETKFQQQENKVDKIELQQQININISPSKKKQEFLSSDRVKQLVQNSSAVTFDQGHSNDKNQNQDKQQIQQQQQILDISGSKYQYSKNRKYQNSFISELDSNKKIYKEFMDQLEQNYQNQQPKANVIPYQQSQENLIKNEHSANANKDPRNQQISAKQYQNEQQQDQQWNINMCEQKDFEIEFDKLANKKIDELKIKQELIQNGVHVVQLNCNKNNLNQNFTGKGNLSMRVNSESQISNVRQIMNKYEIKMKTKSEVKGQRSIDKSVGVDYIKKKVKSVHDQQQNNKKYKKNTDHQQNNNQNQSWNQQVQSQQSQYQKAKKQEEQQTFVQMTNAQSWMKSIHHFQYKNLFNKVIENPNHKDKYQLKLRSQMSQKK